MIGKRMYYGFTCLDGDMNRTVLMNYQEELYCKMLNIHMMKFFT